MSWYPHYSPIAICVCLCSSLGQRSVMKSHAKDSYIWHNVVVPIEKGFSCCRVSCNSQVVGNISTKKPERLQGNDIFSVIATKQRGKTYPLHYDYQDMPHKGEHLHTQPGATASSGAELFLAQHFPRPSILQLCHSLLKATTMQV